MDGEMVSVGSVPRSEDTLRPLPATRHPLAAPEIAPRHEQIGERAGDEEAMGVLV